VDDPEQVTGQISFEATHDLALGVAFGGASGEVCAGVWLVAQSGDDDAEQGGVGSAVAAAVDSLGR
jgi:hypothetical protein